MPLLLKVSLGEKSPLQEGISQLRDPPHPRPKAKLGDRRLLDFPTEAIKPRFWSLVPAERLPCQGGARGGLTACSPRFSGTESATPPVQWYPDRQPSSRGRATNLPSARHVHGGSALIFPLVLSIIQGGSFNNTSPSNSSRNGQSIYQFVDAFFSTAGTG